ncbi:MAG TPA: LysR substrate-binding domain-containing protein [Conexibacter sp.]|jgi:DNA-binding transcriptional LysR family regulator|nr:LysR substrate-binding domain-containing protein [Conexibacter sp.]
MTLQQLQYVLAAIEHGSFSAAADALHLAQPSVSEQIRRLEDELGVALFVRTGRRLVLTEAGRALRPEAEATVAAVARVAEAVADVRELNGGTATFGTFGDVPSWLVANVAATFRRRHPSVRLRIVGLNSSDVADAVREGRVEAGIVVLPVDDDGLDVRPAMRDEVLYASADLAHVRAPVAIEQLARVPMILADARWGGQAPMRRQLAVRAQRAGVRIEPTIEVESVRHALELAARGLGDTVVTARTTRRRGTVPSALHTVAFAEPLQETFAFISRRGAPLSPAARELIALTEQQLGGLRAG